MRKAISGAFSCYPNAKLIRLPKSFSMPRWPGRYEYTHIYLEIESCGLVWTMFVGGLKPGKNTWHGIYQSRMYSHSSVKEALKSMWEVYRAWKPT